LIESQTQALQET